MKKKLTVSVVIPSWNSEMQLKKNLPSVLAAAKKVNAEIIIVDDCSDKDASYTYLQSVGNKIRAYKNSQNEGYGYTVNRGVSYATGDIVILLNTDVKPDVRCFQNALQYFEDKDIFAVTFNSNEGAMRVEWTRGLFHHFKYDVVGSDGGQDINSAWASGGQAAFDRRKWNALGGMDLLYKPFYWEDTDLGYRAWKNGWKIVWGRECICVHDHKASVIAGNFSSEIKERAAQRNQFLFVWKNISDANLLLSHILWLPFYMVHYPQTVWAAVRALVPTLRARASSKRHWVKSDREILRLWR